MEISFEKRYVLVYTLILAITHHILSNINVIYEGIIKEVWPIDAVLFVFTLLFISMFNRNQKQRISLGFFYNKTPFENAKMYIENDKRINSNSIRIKELKDISNFQFYEKYYKPVANNKIVESKNSEYCVIRDIVFILFIFTILFAVLTIIWTDYFWKELIAIIIAYIVGVISCKMKAKDFVSQIVVEKLYKEEKK